MLTCIVTPCSKLRPHQLISIGISIFTVAVISIVLLSVLCVFLYHVS